MGQPLHKEAGVMPMHALFYWNAIKCPHASMFSYVQSTCGGDTIDSRREEG